MSTTSSRRDNLTQTTKDGKIEVTEQELNRATGGSDFRKFKYKWSWA